MNKLREKFKNNRRTAAHFYRLRSLQLDMRIVYLTARPLAHEFGETIKLLQTGQATSLMKDVCSLSLDCGLENNVKG